MMIGGHADRHHGRSSVIEDARGFASAVTASDQRMDLAARQNNPDGQMPDASRNVGRNDRSGERHFVGQRPLPKHRK